MELGVKATFRAHNLCQTFMEAVRVLDRSDKTVKGRWCSFIILKGSNNITAACEEVSLYCLNGVWHKCLPEFKQTSQDLSA